MFDDPSGAGTALLPRAAFRARSPTRQALLSLYPSRMKKSACRPACALLLGNATGWGRPISPTLVRIVVFANNCSDRSASLARKLGAGLSLDVRVVEARLPPAVAHAGAARRAAMDLAEAWLVEAGETDGVILTTDADSQVAPNWIAENLAAFAAGAEAVLGRIDLDEEGACLPEALHRRGELEDTYERLLTELSWLLDPLGHDPWPHHATISGASLGVTRTAYCRVGRFPRVPVGEDKALIALLSRHDARIRHCPTAHVITSGRTHGRAPGGVADTLAIRSREPDAFCDEALEPFRVAFARAAWRGRLRRLHGAGRLALDQDWATKLGISEQEVEQHHPRARIRRGMGRHRGAKPAVCSAIVKADGVARTDIHRASLARPPARRRLRRATTRPAEIGDIDQPRLRTQVGRIRSMKRAAASSPLRG